MTKVRTPQQEIDRAIATVGATTKNAKSVPTTVVSITSLRATQMATVTGGQPEPIIEPGVVESGAAVEDRTDKLPEAEIPAVNPLDNPWPDRINGDITNGIQGLISAGRTLIKAKLSLDHGKFSSMFTEGKLRIDLRTAQLLMRIAKNEALSNANNYSNLPPALNSLSALAGLDQRKLQRAIDAGKITPSMTIADAKSLANKPGGKKAKVPDASPVKLESPAPEDRYDLDSTLSRLTSMLDEGFRLCPEDQVANLLRGLVSHLETFSATH